MSISSNIGDGEIHRRCSIDSVIDNHLHDLLGSLIIDETDENSVSFVKKSLIKLFSDDAVFNYMTEDPTTDNDDEIYYVYIYIDPKSKLPIYVGKGKNLRALSHHRLSFKNLYNKRYNKEFIHTLIKRRKEGYPHPTIIVPCGLLSESDAFEKEKEYIELYGRRDLGTGSLTNLTSGGQGGAISHEIVKLSHNTDKYLKELSTRTKQYWDNLSEEERKKRSDAVKQSYTDELRKKKSESLKRYWQKNKETRKQELKTATKPKRCYAARNKKISEALKSKSLFVTSNPRSKKVVTPYGEFSSIRKAYIAYIQKFENISEYKFRSKFDKEEGYKFK